MEDRSRRVERHGAIQVDFCRKFRHFAAQSMTPRLAENGNHTEGHGRAPPSSRREAGTLVGLLAQHGGGGGRCYRWGGEVGLRLAPVLLLAERAASDTTRTVLARVC